MGSLSAPKSRSGTSETRHHGTTLSPVTVLNEKKRKKRDTYHTPYILRTDYTEYKRNGRQKQDQQREIHQNWRQKTKGRQKQEQQQRRGRELQLFKTQTSNCHQFSTYPGPQPTIPIYIYIYIIYFFSPQRTECADLEIGNKIVYLVRETFKERRGSSQITLRHQIR